MKYFEKPYEDSMKSYFFLESRINENYLDLEDLRYRHEHKNMYTSTFFDEDTGNIYTQAYNLENKVADLVDAERKILDRIGRLNKRLERFKLMFNDLELNERNYLQARYKEDVAIKKQPSVEQKAMAIVDVMDEYKFELSPFRQSRFKKAEKLKKQQEAKNKITLDQQEEKQLIEIF